MIKAEPYSGSNQTKRPPCEDLLRSSEGVARCKRVGGLFPSTLSPPCAKGGADAIGGGIVKLPIC